MRGTQKVLEEGNGSRNDAIIIPERKQKLNLYNLEKS